MTPDWLDDYHRLTSGAAWLEVDARTQMEVRGADRATFLHNVCTADIRALRPGDGAEAFFTTVQGKTLGHGIIYCCPNTLVFDGEPQQGERLLPHLDRYIIREDVQLVDQGASWRQIWLGGPKALAQVGLEADSWPDRPWGHSPGRLEGKPLWLRRLDMTAAPLFALVFSGADAALQAADHLARRLGPPVHGEALEAALREYGFPRFGREITEANLPQEVGRDARAISFRKGCYLGQETVARIDALGHVNRKLVGLRFPGPTPPEAGTTLMWEGKAVGQVASAGYSPRLGSFLAMGYVRRECNAVGSRLESTAGAAEVVPLPVVVEREL